MVDGDLVVKILPPLRCFWPQCFITATERELECMVAFHIHCSFEGQATSFSVTRIGVLDLSTHTVRLVAFCARDDYVPTPIRCLQLYKLGEVGDLLNATVFQNYLESKNMFCKIKGKQVLCAVQSLIP